jgi:Gpi18-like mannosyltransferase
MSDPTNRAGPTRFNRLRGYLNSGSSGELPETVLQPDTAPDAGPGRHRIEDAIPVLNTESGRWHPLLRPGGYYLLSRIAMLFATVVAKWIVPKLPITLLGTLWDGHWYVLIAQQGYPNGINNVTEASPWAFFPAFPAAIRALAIVTRLSVPHAAFVAAFIFGLTSAVALWLAVREVLGPVIADRSVLLYVFFPVAYVLSLAYTEGLFVTAAAACLFALSRRYWITAALFASLASLTRNAGVVLILCLVVVAAPVIWRERALRPLIAVVVSPLGLLAFMAYAWNRVGTPIPFITAQRFWLGNHFNWYESVFDAVRAVILHPQTTFTQIPQYVLTVGALLFVLVGIALLILMHRRGVTVPAIWWIYTIATALIAFSPSLTNSDLRFTIVVLPLFAAYAFRLKPAWEGAAVGCMATAQGVLAVIVLISAVHPQPVPVYP